MIHSVLDSDSLPLVHPSPALRVLSLGWGVQSFRLLAEVALGEREPIDFAINGDTTWEGEETYRFAETWTPWAEARGVNIITVKSPRAHVMINHAKRTAGRYVLTPALATCDSGHCFL